MSLNCRSIAGRAALAIPLIAKPSSQLKMAIPDDKYPHSVKELKRPAIINIK